MAPPNDEASHRRITLKDVAQAAGVSSATVSRVLSGGRPVSPELAQRVLALAEHMDYRPDRIAHSLRKSHSFSVGIVVSDLTNPFYAEIARAAQQVLFPADKVTAVYDMERNPEREREYLNLLLETRVAGLILNSAARDATYFEKFSTRYGVPIVLVDTLRSHVLDSVRVDNYAGTLHAIAHLASRGYQRIAMVAGPQSVLSGFERYDAYCRAIRTYGLESPEGYAQVGDWSEQSGYALTLSLLQLAPRPQAIFAANNTLGLGAFRALKATRRAHPAGCRPVDLR